jgi:hypothetical protein
MAIRKPKHQVLILMEIHEVEDLKTLARKASVTTKSDLSYIDLIRNAVREKYFGKPINGERHADITLDELEKREAI